MVFESLINPYKAERQPYEMFFIGLFYSSFAILISIWIFREQASLVMVFLTVLACIHLIHGVIQMEEEKDTKIQQEKILIKEHGRALSFFLFLFLGFIIGYLMWYIFLPPEVTSSVFKVQQATISEINANISGSATTGYPILAKIFFNNIKVMIFCILFSLFYGSGAIFILAWNASVIATAMGATVLRLLEGSGLIASIAFAAGRYLTHGIFEIAAYFFAGLAGGIISVAVIRHKFGSDEFVHVLVDSIDMLVLSVIVLGFAAVVEVYITPAIF